jgi:two-component sensor histidine kinase
VLPVPELAGLGMLINELVTNAIKYAFPGNAKGTITVATTAREPGSDRGAGSGGRGRLRLVVADDGVGLPESVSLGDSAGFVLTLVSTLRRNTALRSRWTEVRAPALPSNCFRTPSRSRDAPAGLPG